MLRPPLSRASVPAGSVRTWLSSAAVAVLAGAVLLTSTLGRDADAQTVKPHTSAQRKALSAIEADPAPDSVIQDTHYFVSNERHPHRFRKSLTDVGGMYVGVGAEQGYLFSSWAKPEVIIHADFDQMVVDVHTLYRIFLEASPDADAFSGRDVLSFFLSQRAMNASASGEASRKIR